jgi:hypothetical protein
MTESMDNAVLATQEIKRHILTPKQVSQLKFYNDGKYDTPRRYFDLDGVTYAIAMGCPNQQSLKRELAKEKRAYKIIKAEKPDILGVKFWWVYVEHDKTKDGK